MSLQSKFMVVLYFIMLWHMFVVALSNYDGKEDAVYLLLDYHLSSRLQLITNIQFTPTRPPPYTHTHKASTDAYLAVNTEPLLCVFLISFTSCLNFSNFYDVYFQVAQ